MTQSRHMMLYAVFLVVAGGIGYAIGPTHARTAIVGGIGGGLLIAALSQLNRRRVQWSVPALKACLGVFCLSFAWRAAGAWYMVQNGEHDYSNIALLLTSMFAVSLFVGIQEFRRS